MALVLAGYWFLRPKTISEMPKPPIPKSFPQCPEMAAEDYQWHGVGTKYPKGWVVREEEEGTGIKGLKILRFIPPRNQGLLTAFQAVSIHAFKDDKPIKDAVKAVREKDFDPRKVEMIGQDAIPETIKVLRVEDKEAVLFLSRGMGLMPKENDQWALYIDAGRTQYSIDGPVMFNPYYIEDGGVVSSNERLEAQSREADCAFWLVIKNLALPR